jgi:hypothetical protein
VGYVPDLGVCACEREKFCSFWNGTGLMVVGEAVELNKGSELLACVVEWICYLLAVNYS